MVFSPPPNDALRSSFINIALLILFWFYPTLKLSVLYHWVLLIWSFARADVFLLFLLSKNPQSFPSPPTPTIAWHVSLKWAALSHNDTKFNSICILPPLFLFWTNLPDKKARALLSKAYQISSPSWQFLLDDKTWLWIFELKSFGCSLGKKKHYQLVLCFCKFPQGIFRRSVL